MKSLVRRRFGRLKVTAFAGFGRDGRAFWCCLCDCGNTCRVEGRLLLGTKGNRQDGKPMIQISCGCARADPKVRREARMKIPAKKRAEICRRMSGAVTRRSVAYSMDGARAAELLGVSEERVEILAKDGVLGYRYRKGALWVSSGDVSTLIGTQERNRKRCDQETAGIARASAKRLRKQFGERMPWPEDYFRVDPLERKQGVQSTERPMHGARKLPDQETDDFFD